MQQYFQWRHLTDSPVRSQHCFFVVQAGIWLKTAPVLGPGLKSRHFNAALSCQASKNAQSAHDSLQEMQQAWPAWSNNACRKLSQVRHADDFLKCMHLCVRYDVIVQKQAGISVDGPSPLEAVQMLQQLARSRQHTNAPSRLALVCLMHLAFACNICQLIHIPRNRPGARAVPLLSLPLHNPKARQGAEALSLLV